MKLEKVCKEAHAIGDWPKSRSSQTSFGIQHIHFDDQESKNYMDIEVDASQAHVWGDVDGKKDFVRTTKLSKLSSLKGGPLRKKNKISTTN